MASHILDSGYEAIIALLVANFTAQYYKYLKHRRRYGRWDVSVFFSTGGMPSSHSSTVTALSTSVGMIAGWGSPVFAVAACFTFITMYDAAGLRRAAGLQARALNVIVRELMAPDHRLNHEKLKELLGHTPREVLGGALLGVLVSLAVRGVLLIRI